MNIEFNLIYTLQISQKFEIELLGKIQQLYVHPKIGCRNIKMLIFPFNQTFQEQQQPTCCGRVTKKYTLLIELLSNHQPTEN